MSDTSNLLQVSAIAFDSAIDVTELSKFESLAVFPTEQEVYAATAAKVPVLIIHIELIFKFLRLQLKYSMSGNF